MVSRRMAASVDVICLSHLRWNFVFQRPQHLMTRCARERRVYFVEEPVSAAAGAAPTLQIQQARALSIVTPSLPADLTGPEAVAAQRRLLDELVCGERIRDYALWYYTPMALPFTDHLCPRAIVFDCMDELSAFKDAPSDLREHDAELMRRATVVFTGGWSIYEARRHAHPNIHAFPSSVDVAHFAQARGRRVDPPDQASIPGPRLGFFGVIDERMDLDLVAGVAAARPDWHLIMVGPVVKIDPGTLPVRDNIHYLGGKDYGALPNYIAGWDVALLPFARNEATRFISPTKTLEYMAAGKPIVSTPIQDVVRPYGQQGLVRIAATVPAFVRACTAAMAENIGARHRQADAFLRQTSWDGTWIRMRALLEQALHGNDRDITRADGTASI
jgi:UDP-galactopyranose mutase